MQIAEGEMAPWWYGFSYYSPCSGYITCHPIPFNLIVRWARELWWLMRKSKADAVSTAYQRGKRHARRLANARETQAIDTILRFAARDRKDGGKGFYD